MDTKKTERNHKQHIRTMAVSVLAVLLTTGCLNDSDPPEQEEEFIQVVSTSSHGNVLADQDGNVLYVFTRDVKGESMCEGTCIENWPVFYTDQFLEGNGLAGEHLGTITRPDGEMQLTYRGWPLYYFANDGAPGDVNGDGVNDVWYVAKTGYSLMIADEQLTGNDGVDYTSEYEEGEEITTYFTDAEGRTLYRFVNDEANTNNFTDEDFGNNNAWPVFHTDIEELPGGMNESDFGEITVHGQEQQLTYKGWPLYYFGQDSERGETKGVSVPAPGIWPIVNGDTPEAP